MQSVDTECYLTLEECSQRTKLSKRWWNRLVQTRQIPHVKLGGVVRIAEVDFIALMRAHFRPQATKRIDTSLMKGRRLPASFYDSLESESLT